MHVDMSVMQLILDASILVQLVMLCLLVMSVASWALIFVKWSKIKQADEQLKLFEERFWSGVSLQKLYSAIEQKQQARGLEQIFSGGYKAYAQYYQKNSAGHIQLSDSVRRAMRVEEAREVDYLNRHLSFLATVGSVSPYIGLFGTVWGIMNSFLSIGKMQSATLAVVAPGIAEALIATAMGLFAAIPAVILYNRFADGVDRVQMQYENFTEEFVALIERQLSKTAAK